MSSNVKHGAFLFAGAAAFVIGPGLAIIVAAIWMAYTIFSESGV